MLLPHQPGSRALHNAGRRGGAPAAVPCRAPAECARRRARGTRERREPRGRRVHARTGGAAALLGACARGDDGMQGREGGGVGQEGKEKGGGVLGCLFVGAPAFGVGDEFVLVCLCLSPAFPAGKSHGPRGHALRHLGQLPVVRFHCWIGGRILDTCLMLPSHVYVENFFENMSRHCTFGLFHDV
jgi:hypothetical protein